MVRSVYHGENGVRTLSELARSYLTISTDLMRVMTRVKAIYRSWGIPCRGKQVYAERYRAEWLGKIQEAGVRRRAEFYYQQFDALRALRQEVRRELLAEAQKHDAWKLLREIPFDRPDPGGAADRFDANAASFPYQAAALEPTADLASRRTAAPSSAFVAGRAAARQEAGLDSRAESQSQSRSEKYFQGCCHRGRCRRLDRSKSFTMRCVAKGIRPEMARLTLARKIAAITLIVWKKGVRFDAQHLKPQTA